MSASRSLGSTIAPHFVILSTSLVHAALLRRCWTMMRASWHSVHAVVAFAAMTPSGSSSLIFTFCCAVPAISMQSTRLARATTWIGFVLGNMDLHLIYGVVQIAAGIPQWLLGLNATLAVGGTREYGVVSGFCFPFVSP